MAFKTDQIKLKEDYVTEGDAGAPDDGTLALIGATGSKELKFRDDGNWVAISGGGGSLSNVVEDTTPERGGDLITDGNKIAHAAGGATSQLTFTHTLSGEANHTHLASVKSIDFYLDMNGGDNGQAIRVYNDINPNTNFPYAPDDTNYIWKLHQSGIMYMTNNIDMGTNVITDAKVGQWDTTYTEVDAKATDWDTAVTWGNHASAGYSTVDDLNDLSDVATPATLDATHVGKAVGVANTSGVASVISFAVLDLIGLTPLEFRFNASGQEYRINFTQTGTGPVINNTNFTANIATLTTDNGATVSSVGSNLRTLLTNAFDASGYSISGTGGNAVLTADAAVV